MQANIAIVIAAFNRPDSLQRLLDSIKVSSFESYSNIPLIISIDYSGSDSCKKVAENFIWLYGEKRIIEHTTNLKLKNHIIKCGDLTSEFDAIIMLEDDLFVSTQFYDYAQQAYNKYKEDDSLAGIGLYNYRYNEFAYCPFEPLTDGFDNYFMQIPCSCGQIWTKPQWNAFKEYISGESFEVENLAIPKAVLSWPKQSSWKRSFFKYMIERDKYFVYPRISLSTNFGDIGQHYSESVLIWQTALLYEKKQFSFSVFSESICVYDAFFEFETLSYNRISKSNMSLAFDLNGTKTVGQIKTEFLVSSKECTKPLRFYLPALYPYECNILSDVTVMSTQSDSFFTFGRTSDFSDKVILNRLNIDVRRIFFHSGLLTDAAKKEVFNSLPYKIGKLLLYPINFLKRGFHKISSYLKR